VRASCVAGSGRLRHTLDQSLFLAQRSEPMRSAPSETQSSRSLSTQTVERDLDREMAATALAPTQPTPDASLPQPPPPAPPLRLDLHALASWRPPNLQDTSDVPEPAVQGSTLLSMNRPPSKRPATTSSLADRAPYLPASPIHAPSPTAVSIGDPTVSALLHNDPREGGT
jgi:hypothetical protein